MNGKTNKYLCSTPTSYERKTIDADDVLMAACLYAKSIGVSIGDEPRQIITAHPCKLGERVIENSLHVELIRKRSDESPDIWRVLIDSCDYSVNICLILERSNA